MPTPWNRRIIPFSSTVADILRSFWYLRTFLVLLALAVFLTAVALSWIETGRPTTAETRPPSSFAECLYLAVATSCSLDTGRLGAVTPFGKALLLMDAVTGFALLGILIWVLQYCLGENVLKESRLVFLASPKKAVLK